MTRNEATFRTVSKIAGQVIIQHTSFVNVLAAIRARTSGLKYSRALPPVPAKSYKAITLIGHPLQFNPQTMNATSAMEIGKWWGTLEARDRITFAKYVGLWCAFVQARPQ